MESINSDNSLSSIVVNEDAFNAVISEIRNNVDSQIPQPVMIIGQEGSGKTTLLKRLYESCVDRSCIWIDGRNIFSSANIIEAVTLTNNTLMFIDNIDYYFARCSYDEQYRFRRFLYNEGAPMMISTASQVLPAISEYEAPFFEGLKITYINPISNEEMAQILGKILFERAMHLWDLLPPTIKSVLIIHGIIKLNNVLEKDRGILLSLFSAQYRTLYQSQPIYSQHILNALSMTSVGIRIPEIRDLTGLKTSILTAYLKSLKNSDIINVDATIKKNTLYAIKDPLFRLWLQTS